MTTSTTIMKVYNLLQSSLLFSLCGNAGSPLHTYDSLLADGHIEKALQAPADGFFISSGMTIHHSIQDAKMHDSVEMLRIMFDQVATTFYKAVMLEGSDLLNYNIIVNSITSITELDINAMARTLSGAKRKFKNVEDNMIALQTEVHSLIETVRRRIIRLQDEIKENEAQHQSVDEKIELLENKIRDNEDSARDLDTQEHDMMAHAHRMEREEESAAKWGAAELLGAVGVGVLGYFTGGIGFLAPTVILGGLGVKNVNDAGDYRSRANNFRNHANRARRRARELRYEVEQSKRSKSHLQENAKFIQRQIVQLEASLSRVNELSNSLHGSVGATNELVLMLQDMVVTVFNAELDAKSLQDWFEHLPKVIKKASVSLLETTKSAWKNVQHLVRLHHRLLT